MVFDEQRYIREVLEPARAAGNQPPDDLRVRYALIEPLVSREVTESIRRVRMCWRKARGQLRFRRLIDRLEGEHLKLAHLFERAGSGDLAPLRAALTTAGERTESRRAELRDRLLDAAGSLGMLTPGELRDIGGEAAGQAADAGIEVREPDRLLASPPYAGYPRARDALDALGHRHLREFVTGDPRAGRTFGRPADLGGEVDRVAERWSRRAHDGNRTNADTVLIALKRAGDRLGELILYDLITRLRERHQQRASDRALFRFAVDDLGIDEDDARRLVFAVQREDGPRPGGFAARLRELVDGGQVQAAAELAATGTDLTGDAEILAAEARRRVTAATALRQEATALVLSDPDAAWMRLADALDLVGDLPGAAELQAGLPPGVPGRVDVLVEGTEVSLSWPPTASRVGEIGYVVVRCLGRVPRHPGDGEPLPAGDGPFARDTAPPLNAPVHYAVFAVRGHAASPPALAGPVHVRPEPAHLLLTAADGVVTGRWMCPPEAVRVLVTRDGAPMPADRAGFRDESVRNGVTYHYRVAAAYLGPDGHEIVTGGVHAAVTPVAHPDAVEALAVEQRPDGRLMVAYDEPRHGQVEFVALPGPPPWPAGTTLPADDVRRAGRILTTSPVPGGAVVRSGAGVLVAVSVSGSMATVGAHHEHVNLAPPVELVAERRGEEIMLGFDWPPDVAEAEVRWCCNGGEARMLLVGRAGYDAHGGIRLPALGGAAVRIEVAAAAVARGRRVTGEPVTTEVPGRAVVRYALRRSLPRGGLVLTLTSAAPVRLPRLVLVARSGPMPQRSGDGETVMTWDDLDVPARLRVPMPRLTRPFWLRCFAEDAAVELRDPPVRHLKVG